MFLSSRNVLSKNDAAWESYVAFINFSVPDVIYTIDSSLNDHILESCLLYLNELGEIAELKAQLPAIDHDLQYYQLAINVDEEQIPELPDNIDVLGFDICDETLTSSLLNCGVWEKELEPIVTRINQYGLLTLDDAKIAQDLLPKVWGEEEPHASVDIWCICKVN